MRHFGLVQVRSVLLVLLVPSRFSSRIFLFLICSFLFGLGILCLVQNGSALFGLGVQVILFGLNRGCFFVSDQGYSVWFGSVHWIPFPLVWVKLGGLCSVRFGFFSFPFCFCDVGSAWFDPSVSGWVRVSWVGPCRDRLPAGQLDIL